jgi:predicted nucleic acid-binding protein
VYPVVHVDADIGRLAYSLLKRYARSDGLRTFDSLIAATAIERGFWLVSKNRKHFAMIDGLRLEAPRY